MTIGSARISSNTCATCRKCGAVKWASRARPSLHSSTTTRCAGSYETLRLPDDPDHAYIAHTVDPGTPSETALRLLANWAAGIPAKSVPGQ